MLSSEAEEQVHRLPRYFKEVYDPLSNMDDLSLTIKDVTEAILLKMDKINFHQSDLQSIKQGMYNIAAFPNVIGAVDGSMFSIQKPLVNSNAYLCRKKYYATNGLSLIHI